MKNISKLQTRLNRAEGQIRGIRKMIEKDVDDKAVLQQLAAVRAALDKAFYVAVGLQLSEALTSPKNRTNRINEYIELLQKYG